MFTKEYLQNEIDELIHRAVTGISPDVREAMELARDRETSPAAKNILSTMLLDLDIAKREDKAVCQSPGFPAAYITLCRDAMDFDLKGMICASIRKCTEKGYLRPSLVDSITRINPFDNSGVGVPTMDYDYQPGLDHMDIIISFKGCGAELGNIAKIVIPADLGPNLEGVKTEVLKACANAGGKPCPPCIIGVGIGGQMDACARLSRKAVSVRKINDRHPNPRVAAMEEELTKAVNELGLGAAGIGGDTYALAVKIEYASTHTALEPMAVNFSCWVARRAGVRLYTDGRKEILL